MAFGLMLLAFLVRILQPYKQKHQNNIILDEILISLCAWVLSWILRSNTVFLFRIQLLDTYIISLCNALFTLFFYLWTFMPNKLLHVFGKILKQCQDTVDDEQLPYRLECENEQSSPLDSH